MKKFSWMIALILLILVISGCGGNNSNNDNNAGEANNNNDDNNSEEANNNDNGTTNNNSEAEGKSVGIAMPTKSSERWVDDGDNMQKEFEDLGYDVTLQYAEDVVENQVSQIQNMITKDVDILVIASIDGEALTEVLEQADRKSTRLNSSHVAISYAVFCLKKKK